MKRKYLVVFAHAFEEFRLPELLSICELYNVVLEKETYSDAHPYMVISSKNEADVHAILSRCVLIQFISEVWEECKSRDELCKAQFEGRAPVTGSFNILLHSFGRKVSMKEKIELIEDMEHLPLTGEVNCSNPDNVYYICENYSDKQEGPTDVYFGPLIGRSNRALIDSYSVKKRLYIGRTTMDAQLSFIMANLARIDRGDLVYDPFLGTGSLIIPAAVHGAFTLGSDIDIKALHGWGKSTKKGEEKYQPHQNIEGNMTSYGLSTLFLGSLASDFSTPLIRDTPLFDVILTDPPYGIREASLKVNSNHHLAESQSSLSHQFLELLNFAARSLVVGGRLVYWLPVIRDLYMPECLPQHPVLRLQHNCQQILNKKSARRLLVLQKTREPVSEDDIASAQGEETCHGKFREFYFSKSCDQVG